MIGRTVSHYEILEELGGGGMGVVYRALDNRLGRSVALKFLPPEWSRDNEARERFTREARAASAIDHPHICTVYDIGETDEGQLFIAMAYCPGESLMARIRRGPLPVESAVNLTIQAADALRRTHRAGIVHRDIKPANILLTEHSEAKIVDFGLAKLAGEGMLTRDGAVVGTPAYMSPEQASGETIDHRTDIWSLGVVLYEMLSGSRPFKGDNSHAVLFAVVNNDPEPIDEVRPEIPPALREIVGKCLGKDPDNRYATADELLRDLRRFRGDSWPSEEVTRLSSAVSDTKRRRWVAYGAAAAAVVLALLGFSQRDRLAELFAPDMPSEKTLVVLPFTSTDTSPVVATLCDGLLEELTETLGGMQRFQGTLTVVPASAVRSERIAGAGQALTAFGANIAVVGRVESARGDVLRIVLELLDTAGERLLRRRTIPWTGQEGDTLQSTMVSALSEMLEVELDEGQQRELSAGGTTDRAAFQLYAEALGLMEPPAVLTNVERATDLLREALEYDPGFTLARVALADACRARYGLTDEESWARAALTYARQAVTEDARLPRAHVVLGMAIADTDGPDGGLTHIEHALELDPLNQRALRSKARLHIDMDDAAAAEATFRDAISLRPDDWVTLNRAGLFYFQDRLDFDTAASFFRDEVEQHPESTIGWANLGASLFMSGKTAEARSALQRGLVIGSSYTVFANLGTLEFYSGKYNEACTLYEQALAIDDSSLDLWNNLAESRRWGKKEANRIVEAYSRVAELVEAKLEHDPENVQLLIDLASARTQTGEQAAARRALDRSLALGVEDAGAMFALSAVFEDLGDRATALSWIAASLRNGYPAQVIETYPGFKEIREDPRFRALMTNHTAPSTEQPGATQGGGV